MALLAFGVAAVRAANCDYYASPSGTGDGLTAASPFRVSNFWPVAVAGKTLCLLDGTYTDAASLILPPHGLNGASGAPITIRAVNDGKVLLNGQGGHVPVQLYYNDWFVIEGVNACCSSETVVRLTYSNNNVIRRVAAWDAADSNFEIFGAHYASLHNLFEDVAGWGTARKIFQMSQGGDYTTIRRAWGRWERSTVVGPKMTYELSYNNYNLICENCLGTWSGQGMPESYVLMGYDGNPWTGNGAGTYTNYDVNQPYGIFSGSNDYKLLGSLAYVLPTDVYKAPQGIKALGTSSLEIRDTASYIAPGTNPSVKPMLLWATSNATNLQAADLTSFGGAGSQFAPQWSLSNVWSGSSPAAYPPGENIFNTTKGANLSYRYQDGRRTDQALWPWPMNQRIKEAIVQSGRDPVDVTVTVLEIFRMLVPRLPIETPASPPPSPRALPGRPGR